MIKKDMVQKASDPSVNEYLVSGDIIYPKNKTTFTFNGSSGMRIG